MIEIKNLQKVIQGNLTLDIPALTVNLGEIAAAVGPAGSGWETLFEILLGRSRPTVGTVSLDGIDPVQDKVDFSQRVGVMFQQDSHYARQSALANLLFHGQLHHLPRQRAEDILAQVGLADRGGTRADKLPSGMSRRLAFGRAILHQPQVLLLVEPFARCDEASIALMQELVRSQAAEGVATLILTDDDRYLTSICNWIHTLAQGRITSSYNPYDERRVDMPFKIPARLEDKVALVNPSDIFFVLAEQSRTYLQTADGRLPTQFTLTELEQRLSRSGFFRAHRAYLVNLQHVTEVIPYTRNSFSLRLGDGEGTKIPLSKSAAAELRELLGY